MRANDAFVFQPNHSKLICTPSPISCTQAFPPIITLPYTHPHTRPPSIYQPSPVLTTSPRPPLTPSCPLFPKTPQKLLLFPNFPPLLWFLILSALQSNALFPGSAGIGIADICGLRNGSWLKLGLPSRLGLGALDNGKLWLPSLSGSFLGVKRYRFGSLWLSCLLRRVLGAGASVGGGAGASVGAG